MKRDLCVALNFNVNWICCSRCIGKCSNNKYLLWFQPTPSPHPVPEYPASQRDFNHRATESDQSIQKVILVSKKIKVKHLHIIFVVFLKKYRLNVVNVLFLLKHKGCSLKKICKYIVWTAIFLGISIGVALSTFNNVNTSDLERQMLKGEEKFIFKLVKKKYYILQ